MNLKKIVFLFFSLACLPSIQINAALTPSTVSSAACCRPLGAVAQRAPNHFSCESFAQQGIYLPPCDKAQARLWHGILQDPELQGDQPTSSWSPGALTAAVGIGAAGTMTLYNLHQLRNARQRAADKALEGEIDFQRPPTIVEVPAQQPTPKIIAPVASTPWWKQSIMPAAAAFVSGGLGSLAAFKHLQNQPHNAATASHLSELPLNNLLDREDSDFLPTTRSTDSTQEKWKKINGQVALLDELRRKGFHPTMDDDWNITIPVEEQEAFKKIHSPQKTPRTPKTSYSTQHKQSFAPFEPDTYTQDPMPATAGHPQEEPTNETVAVTLPLPQQPKVQATQKSKAPTVNKYEQANQQYLTTIKQLNATSSPSKNKLVLLDATIKLFERKLPERNNEKDPTSEIFEIFKQNLTDLKMKRDALKQQLTQTALSRSYTAPAKSSL